VIVEYCDDTWAGSIATRLLAEAGAGVVKIEVGEHEDRRRDPRWATWNRSKRLIRFAAPPREQSSTGWDDLLGRADVLVHDLSPARARQSGLESTELASRYPRLVIASVTGYPVNHPDCDRTGSDVLVQARSGLMGEQSCDRCGPTFLRLPLPTFGAAMLAAGGVLARLIERQESGRGGVVATSLLQGALAYLSTVWKLAESPSERLASKAALPRRRLRYIYRAGDDRWLWAYLTFLDVPLVIETLAGLGIEAPDLDAYEADEERVGKIYQHMFEQRPAAEWLEAFRAADVPVALVNHIGEVFFDDQAVINGYTVDVHDERWGLSRQFGLPFESDPPCRVCGPAPYEPEPLARVIADLPPDARAEPPEGATRPEQPLAGLRVLDFGMYISSPLSAQLLADLGADVIKVEPRTGDRLRPEELTFLASARGKRSLALDLTAPGSKEVLQRLVASTDVVIHNLRLSAAARLGLAEEDIRAVNPQVVLCHVSAFGPRGPLADAPGLDPMAQCSSGVMAAAVPPGSAPMWHRMLPGDCGTGLLTLSAVLLGIYQRHASGRGTTIRSSMLAAGAMLSGDTLATLPQQEIVPISPINDDVTGISAVCRIYRCADGWVAVSGGDLERASERLRGAFDATTEEEVAAKAADMTVWAALDRLRSGGIPAEHVREDNEESFFADPANRAAGLVAEYPHPIYGRLKQVGSFWHLDDMATRLDRAPPTLGQDTRSVLIELGYADEDIRYLASQGVVAGDAVL
jgi:crotonobetainyl-CoA:carnitine CoA-transferase CaiB-like acyl-CoA transferase